MNLKYEILVTPTKTGSVELKTRFVVCAMESTGIIPLYSVPMHKWLYQTPKAFKGLPWLRFQNVQPVHRRLWAELYHAPDLP